MALRAAGGAAWDGARRPRDGVGLRLGDGLRAALCGDVRAGGRRFGEVADSAARALSPGRRAGRRRSRPGGSAAASAAPPAMRHHVVGADPGRERRQPPRPAEAAGRRVATDQPDRDVGRGRVGEGGQPAVPVAVLGEDRADRRLVELGQRLRLGEDVAVGPRRVGGADGGDRLVEVVVGRSTGSLDRIAMITPAGWPAGRGGRGARAGARRPAAPPRSSRPSCGRRPGGRSRSRPAARTKAARSAALSRNRWCPCQWPGPAVPGMVDGDDPPAGGGQGRPDPPPDAARRGDAVDQQQRRRRRIAPGECRRTGCRPPRRRCRSPGRRRRRRRAAARRRRQVGVGA